MPDKQYTAFIKSVANLHKIILILHQLDKKVEATAQIIA